MTDKEFISYLVDYFSVFGRGDARLATYSNAIINRLNDVSNKMEEEKKVIYVVKKKCSSGNSNLWLVTCVPDYKTYMVYINDTSNHDHDLVRAEHNVLTEEEFNLLKRYMTDKEEVDEKN